MARRCRRCGWIDINKNNYQMSERLKNILISAGVAFFVAIVTTSSDENETENKNLAISAPRQFQTIVSDFRLVKQTERVDYWNVGDFVIPDNFIVSEIFAEIYDSEFNSVIGNCCVWVAQNTNQQYAVGLLSENPGSFNIRLVAKVIEI